ncbi:MAG TPA: hypothetical protein DHW82_08405 [Spirochaetia bacterium]|nr:hypothetical protein [Spirochaetia bacterium]
MKKKLVRLFLIFLFLIVLFPAVGVLCVYFYHEGDYQEKNIYDYGVVFGAAIRSQGRLSGTLKSRMMIAIKLYKDGTVKKLIFSGSVKNQIKPGEPKTMYQFAVDHQVHPEDIILDEKGDNTLATILNVKKTYFQNGSKPKILFISSFFHLARIKLTSSILGMGDSCGLYPSDTNNPDQADRSKLAYFVFREAVAIWYYVLKSFYLSLSGGI